MYLGTGRQMLFSALTLLIFLQAVPGIRIRIKMNRRIQDWFRIRKKKLWISNTALPDYWELAPQCCSSGRAFYSVTRRSTYRSASRTRIRRKMDRMRNPAQHNAAYFHGAPQPHIGDSVDYRELAPRNPKINGTERSPHGETSFHGAIARVLGAPGWPWLCTVGG